MPVYNSSKEFQASEEKGPKLEFLRRDGKIYTGKDMERILKRDEDEKTVKKLKDRTGMGSTVGAYASDALKGAMNFGRTATGGKPVESESAVKNLKRNKEQYETAKNRLDENKYRKGGSVSKRGDGIATKGKTKGRFV